eukprot:evm.model.NODE_14521_length_13041_cov_40.539452.2
MGRVSNRFSHDLQTIDKEVMAGAIRFGDMLLALIGVLVVTVYAVPPLIVAMRGLDILEKVKVLINEEEEEEEEEDDGMKMGGRTKSKKMPCGWCLL